MSLSPNFLIKQCGDVSVYWVEGHLVPMVGSIKTEVAKLPTWPISFEGAKKLFQDCTIEKTENTYQFSQVLAGQLSPLMTTIEDVSQENLPTRGIKRTMVETLDAPLDRPHLSRFFGPDRFSKRLAKAYIKQTGITVEQYIALFNDFDKSLLRYHYARNLYIAYQLSVLKVKERSAPSLALLSKVAYLDSEEIPLALLFPDADEDLIKPLIEFGLLDQKSSLQSLFINPLLQDLIRRNHVPSVSDETMVELFNRIKPHWDVCIEKDPTKIEISKQIFPHLLALCEQAPPTIFQRIEVDQYFQELSLFSPEMNKNINFRTYLMQQAVRVASCMYGSGSLKVDERAEVLIVMCEKAPVSPKIDRLKDIHAQMSFICGNKSEQEESIIPLIGTAYMKDRQYKEAIDYLTKSVKIMEEWKLKNGEDSKKQKSHSLVKYHLQLGYCHFCLNDLTQALDHFKTAQQINEANFDPINEQEAITFSYLSDTYLRMHDVDQAIAFELKALEIYKTLEGDQYPSKIEKSLKRIEQLNVIVQHRMLNEISNIFEPVPPDLDQTWVEPPQ